MSALRYETFIVQRDICGNNKCDCVLLLVKVFNPDKQWAEWQAFDQSANSRQLEQTLTFVRSPTADFGVLVFADNAVGSLGGMEETLPGQRTSVAELGIVVQQHQASADAAQWTQPERLDVQILDGEWKHSPGQNLNTNCR